MGSGRTETLRRVGRPSFCRGVVHSRDVVLRADKFVHNEECECIF